MDQTGYACLLVKPIDFDLLENLFEFSSDTVVSREHNSIDYQYGLVSILTKR